MDKLKMHTTNRADDNFAKLSALFPNAVTEAINENGELVRAIDKDILMQEISTSVVEGREERYQFTWPDKKKSILLANAPINKTLRPCREESVDFDNTENLYIEGDNLEVLKLLQETYLGKIKMIYIDPPYNTGNDFVYEDDFAQSTDEYMENSGQYDEDGNRLFKNMDSNGRFHTDWLNMIYPRLKLARDLLTDDGVIFISIDDNEVENLKKICSEIFGSDNYIDTLHWKRKKQPSFLAKHTAKVMEYVLVFGKNSNSAPKLSIESISDETKKVVNLTNNVSERIFKAGVQVKVGKSGVIPKGIYTIKSMQIEYLNDVVYENGITVNDVVVKARFSVSQDLILKFIEQKLLFITVNHGLRRYVSEEEKNNKKAITDLLLDWGDNQDSDKEQAEIFKAKYFDYTKPTKLLFNLVKSITDKENDIILDFFSGSATTAHAVMQLNAEDGGNRKFIMVQLPEATDEKSEAYNAGYKNICEIGKERIRRAGKKILEEKAHLYTGFKEGAFEVDELGIGEAIPVAPTSYTQMSLIEEQKKFLDVGFRVLKCDSSNMKDVYYYPEETEAIMFDSLISNIKEDRKPEDLLMQVMFDLGVLLSSKIESYEINGKKVFSVDDDYLIACFESDVTSDIIEEIAKKKPYYFVMRDSSLKDSSVAVNFEQLFKAYSPDTVRMVL